VLLKKEFGMEINMTDKTTREKAKERGMIFNAEFIPTLLDGSKTQTRRLINPQPAYQGIEKMVYELHPFAPSTLIGTPAEGTSSKALEKKVWQHEDWCGNLVGVQGDSPYGKVGDRIWVKEKFKAKVEHFCGEGGCDCDGVAIFYVADQKWRGMPEEGVPEDWTIPDGNGNIHESKMPRWASRITLEITDVRVERIQDINDKPSNYLKEGFEDDLYVKEEYAWEQFQEYWEKIYPLSWKRNDWVWVYEFKRLKG